MASTVDPASDPADSATTPDQVVFTAEEQAVLDQRPTPALREKIAGWLKKAGDAKMRAFLLEMGASQIERTRKQHAIRAQLGDESAAAGPYRPREFAVYRQDDPHRVARVKAVRRNTRHPFDASEAPAPWRITTYDQHGPRGHLEFRTLDEVATELLTTSGEQVPGQIAQWAQTETWAQGLAWLAARREADRQRIPDRATAPTAPEEPTAPHPALAIVTTAEAEGRETAATRGAVAETAGGLPTLLRGADARTARLR